MHDVRPDAEVAGEPGEPLPRRGLHPGEDERLGEVAAPPQDRVRPDQRRVVLVGEGRGRIVEVRPRDAVGGRDRRGVARLVAERDRGDVPGRDPAPLEHRPARELGDGDEVVRPRHAGRVDGGPEGPLEGRDELRLVEVLHVHDGEDGPPRRPLREDRLLREERHVGAHRREDGLDGARPPRRERLEDPLEHDRAGGARDHDPVPARRLERSGDVPVHHQGEPVLRRGDAREARDELPDVGLGAAHLARTQGEQAQRELHRRSALMSL